MSFCLSEPTTVLRAIRIAAVHRVCPRGIRKWSSQYYCKSLELKRAQLSQGRTSPHLPTMRQFSFFSPWPIRNRRSSNDLLTSLARGACEDFSSAGICSADPAGTLWEPEGKLLH